MLIDIPKDIVDPKNPNSAMDWYWPTDDEVRDGLPGYRPTTKGHPRMIREAAELILAAERPVIYAGGGILKARAAEALRELAELMRHPRRHHADGPGRLPRRPPAVPRHAGHARQLHRGHVDAGGRPAHRPRQPLRRPGHRQGRRRSPPTPRSSTSTSTRPSWARCAGPTCRSSATAASSSRSWSGRCATCSTAAPRRPTAAPWKQTHLAAGRRSYPLTYEPSEPGDALKPQYVLEQLRDNAPDDTIVASRRRPAPDVDVSQYWKFHHPYTWVNSGGLGTMGFAVPAAIGAKVGRPDRMVWAVDGDGCFQMTAQELVTAAAERIPVKVAILNNAYLGMVRQWQEMFYEERYSEVYLSPDLPDYEKWAEAMGCVGMRVESPEEVAAGHREGQRDRRPPGRHRVPHRQLARRCSRWSPAGASQRRHHRRPGAGRRGASE